MRYRLTGHVRAIVGNDAFSLEIDPNGRLVFDTGVPSNVDIRLAPDSPVRDTVGLCDVKVTCLIVDPQRRPVVARVHRCLDVGAPV